MKATVPIGLATKASAKITKDQSTPDKRIEEREHHPREDQHRGEGEDEEIEEFRAAADHHADGDVGEAGVGGAVDARTAGLVGHASSASQHRSSRHAG